MAGRTTTTTTLTSDVLSAADLVKALEEKRKSLDQEIAQFNASKEEEFRIYEHELRSRKKGQSDKAASVTGDNYSRFDATLTEFPKTAIHKVEGPKRVRSFPEIQKCSSSATASDVGRSSELRPHERPCDREIEFQGLFTPTYLPLLEKPPRTAKRDSKDPPTSPSLDAMGSSSPDKDRAGNHLSSSATLPTIAFDPLHTPPETAPVSASMPRPNGLHERRSSSRSDTSITSLRSSLRQAKASRSPKHVLFSIDNIVLSPSTSPISRRKETVPPIPFSGLVSLPSTTRPSVDSDNHKIDTPKISHASRSTMEQKADVTVPPRSTSLGSVRSQNVNLASFASSKSYNPFLESTSISSKTRGDDDALFSFDEDEDMDMQELDGTAADPVFTRVPSLY